MNQQMPHVFTKTILLSAAICACAQTVAAQTADGKRGEIYCFPAKDVPKLVARIDKVDAKRRDVVDVKLDPKFLIKDGGVWPDAFYLAREGEIVTQMPVSREDGRVPNFLEAVEAAPDTDICVVDPTRADKPEDDEGLYFEMGLSPLFQIATGEHDMSVLKKGARDAKSFYKKMIPAAFRMFMPDTNYLAVKYRDPTLQTADATAAIFARRLYAKWARARLLCAAEIMIYSPCQVRRRCAVLPGVTINPAKKI